MEKQKFFYRINGTLTSGFLTFIFFLLIFSILRIGYIIFLYDYSINVTTSEILSALWTGLKLSCQTSGICTLIIIIAKIISRSLEKFLVFTIILTTTILFMASLPFYREFHSNFNQIIFNAINDDLYALLITFFEQFNLISRLFGAIILAAIFYKIFIKVNEINLKIPLIISLFITYIFTTLTIFGGGLNWQNELNFENIGITKDKLLNEAILDSFQAIHRGYVLQNRIISSTGLNFSAEDIQNLAKNFSEIDSNSQNLDDYLKKFAKGNKIEKPTQIFLIISESFANWTVLEKYSKYHLSDGMREIIQSEDSCYCPTFLPNGGSTVSAVTGVVSGLADANLYLTTISRSFEEKYSTAIAPQMKNLGYETNFYYAGSSTWEKIEEFTIAQGFDNFYSEGDIKSGINEKISGNVWGVDDKYLYEFVEKNFDEKTASFNVILNTSNHAPYTVDLESEKIDNEFAEFDEELVKKLRHQIYADKELKKFIDKMREKFPKSLFIIIGDHADRCNIDKNPNDYERFCIPFIIYGNGINKEFFDENSAGSQIDIMPTIIELIAPKNFEYYSIGRSLSENKIGVNYALFITRHSIGDANKFPLEAKLIESDEQSAENLTEIEKYINYVRGISYWRAKFGKNLQKN